jgi:hypothetical protein
MDRPTTTCRADLSLRRQNHSKLRVGVAEDRQQAGQRYRNWRRRGLLDRRHHGLPLLIPALPETVAGTTGERQYEAQNSDNTHDLISSLNFANCIARASVPNKKPQAFSRCG